MGEQRNERNLIGEMISAAVLAGAYTVTVRRHPEATKGLEKLRVKWSARVGALADEFLSDAGFVLASELVPHSREG